MNNQNANQDLKGLLDQQSEKTFRVRQIKDIWARYGIAVGGMLVIFAVALIFFYLLAVVLPMFQPPSVELQYKDQVQLSDTVLHSEVDEYGEIIASVQRNGQVVFSDINKAATIASLSLTEETVDAFGTVSLQRGIHAILSGTNLKVFAIKYRLEYPDGKRVSVPYIDYPLGDQPINLGLPESARVSHFSAYMEEELLKVATVSGRLLTVSSFALEESMMDDGITVASEGAVYFDMSAGLEAIHFGEDQSRLFATFVSGEVQYLELSDEGVALESSFKLFPQGERSLVSSAMLLGNFSLLVGSDNGEIFQLFLRRDDNNKYDLVNVRSFKLADSPINIIVSENRRKGFMAVDAAGEMGLFYTTSQRKLLTHPVGDSDGVAINSRNNLLVSVKDGLYSSYRVDNEHPEISWSALWRSVWYEGYQEPDVIWQSSASTNDFEPKFSLTPLTFGTLKAAFYAMLFSIPLALSGALFTAFFMTPEMRRIVKPTIEIMEALPTVILGFLAGLWLAPMVESNLAGVFGVLIVMPFAFVLFGLGIAFLPQSIKNILSAGWQAALLIPVIIVAGWLSFSAGGLIDDWFFNGDLRQWVSDEENGLGIGYDQRNALVVGIAMGFAVIPTIFSITEDAVFSVPRHLVNGSLALGATPWQTVVRVVLPTASPGMFSAVMIGFGRAVGETIIVLMATGNTPIMDMNIFEGMRTLSANIAVELPESEVGSTHFRVLFLASFVLFLFTFFFNTLAEVIRQRLRTKYGSL